MLVFTVDSRIFPQSSWPHPGLSLPEKDTIALNLHISAVTFMGKKKWLTEKLKAGRYYFGSQFQRVRPIIKGTAWESGLHHGVEEVERTSVL